MSLWYSFHAAVLPDTSTPTAHSAAKQCSTQIQMLGVGFQMPFSKPYFELSSSEWQMTDYALKSLQD